MLQKMKATARLPGDLGDGLPKEDVIYAPLKSIPASKVSTKPNGCSSPSITKIKLKLEDIQVAHKRIKDFITVTPLIEAKYLGKNFCKLYFKCENLQITGSFKARGASNVISSLTAPEKSRGCTVSGGRNFLYAMTHCGFSQSVPVNVVIPRDCPLADKERYRENFALIKVYGSDSNEATLHAITHSETIGSNYIYCSDRLDLLAGYGTLGLEILSQLERLDAVLCPVGSGGLAASLILAVKSLKPKCLIYETKNRAHNEMREIAFEMSNTWRNLGGKKFTATGVECTAVPTMTRALQERKPVMVPVTATAADSLSAIIAGTNAYHIVRRYLDRMITVDEEWISRAMVSLYEREKLVVEGAAACPLAAIMAGKVPELKGMNVVCVISGGNTTAAQLPSWSERGLAAAGRLVRLAAPLPGPGSLQRLLARVADCGAEVRDLAPDHAWMRRDLLVFSVNMLIETTDLAHAKDLEKKLMKEYPGSQLLIQ